jgi:hypothetical protein
MVISLNALQDIRVTVGSVKVMLFIRNRARQKNRRKEEHIPPNTRNTEKTIEEIKKEIKLENIQTKSPYPNQNTLNLKDKIFIFLIITIFFDIF